MNTNVITQDAAKVDGRAFETSLRKIMIVLATAAALTGGLTADAFARGGGGGGGHGGGFGGGAHMGSFGGAAHIGGDFGLGHLGGHGVAFGRSRRFVPGLGYGFNDYGCSYGYPITIAIAAICLRTNVRQRQRPPSRLCQMRIKSRIVLAGSVPHSDYWAATLVEPECAIDRFLSLACLKMAASKVVYLRAWLWMNGVFSMNRASATRRIARIGFAPVLLWLAAEVGIANAQTGARWRRLRSSRCRL